MLTIGELTPGDYFRWYEDGFAYEVISYSPATYRLTYRDEISEERHTALAQPSTTVVPA